MFLLKRLQYYRFDWIVLFFGSLIVRLIGINYGLPYEHNSDEKEYFSISDNLLNTGKLDPGIQIYGYIFFYLVYFSSFAARLFIHSGYIREYEILFFRVVLAIITSLSVVVIYEIARRVYKNKLLSFFPAAFLAVSVGAVTLAHFSSSDNVISLLLYLTVLCSVIYLKEKSKKALVLMFILTGLMASSKFSYGIFFAYPVLIYLLVNGFKITKNKLLILSKYSLLMGSVYILANIFELPHLKNWLGRNYYIMQAYNTDSYFYFKNIHENYFVSLFTSLKFTFADFYINSKFSLYIMIIILGIFAYKCFKIYKLDKKILVVLILFPLIFLLLTAKAKVFQMRTLLGIAPLFSIVFFYPLKLEKLKIVQIVFVTLLIIVAINTTSRFIDVEKHNAEKQVMDFVDMNKGFFALPNVFYYPQIQYAYYDSSNNFSLEEHPFFRRNRGRIIFYQQNSKLSASNYQSNIEEILPKVDYFVIQKQMLQSFNYKEANRLKLEPEFEAIDINPSINIEDLLKKYNFNLISSFQTSEYETILKYDPAYLGLKNFEVYRKRK